MKVFLFVCVVLSLATERASAQANACKSSARGTCQCDLLNQPGMQIDLRPLESLAPLRTSSVSYSYFYKFCSLITGQDKQPNCNNQAAVCEYGNNGNDYNMDLGRPSTVRFEMRTSDKHKEDTIALVADSSNIDGEFRRSVAFLNCDEQSPDVTFVSYGYSNNKDPDGYLIYTMDLGGKAFCPTPGGGGGGGDNDGALSGGSILLIIFFVTLTVYFVGGFLFLTYYKKAQGIDRIPNVHFWMMLPGLAKEGFFFTWNSFTRLIGKK